MIKSELRSAVLNSLLKWDSTAKYHPRFLDAVIEKTRNEVLTELWSVDPNALQRFTKGYGYTTALAVGNEASTGIYYTTLPQNIVPFPDKASGVRRVATATQTSIKFYPMDQREWDLVLGGSYTNYVKNRIGYIVTPTRVEFYGMTGAVSGAGVRMDLIIPFSEYTDTDVVLIPEHVNNEGLGLIDRCVAKLMQVPTKVDQSDDNKDIE